MRLYLNVFHACRRLSRNSSVARKAHICILYAFDTENGHNAAKRDSHPSPLHLPLWPAFLQASPFPPTSLAALLTTRAFCTYLFGCLSHNHCLLHLPLWLAFSQPLPFAPTSLAGLSHNHCLLHRCESVLRLQVPVGLPAVSTSKAFCLAQELMVARPLQRVEGYGHGCQI